MALRKVVMTQMRLKMASMAMILNLDEAVDEEGNGDDNDPRDSNGGDEELGTRDVDDEGSDGDEEDDYGYRDLVDEADNEEDSDDEPLDVADDALGPEDGEGDR